jgi:hypothetical protein
MRTGAITALLLILLLGVIPGCGRGGDKGNPEAGGGRIVDELEAYDRVCIRDNVPVYSDEVLTQPSGITIVFWDMGHCRETSPDCTAEEVAFPAGTGWVSTKDVHPLYVTTAESELCTPRVDEVPGEGTMPRLGQNGYIPAGENVAVEPGGEDADFSGYVFVHRQDGSLGLTLLENLKPLGDPGGKPGKK